MVASFFDQLLPVLEVEGSILVELFTDGGDAEIGRRLAAEVRLLRQQQGRDVWFLGKTLVLLCHLSVSTLDWSLEATRASRQCVDEVDGKTSSQCCDGVGDVALRPDGRRRAGGSLGVAQVPRSSPG